MELIFQLHYDAPEGSTMKLCPEGTRQGDLVMDRRDNGWWELKTDTASFTTGLHYKYAVTFPNGTSRKELAGRSHTGLPKTGRIYLIDRWTDLSYAYVFPTHKIQRPKKSDITTVIKTGHVPEGYHLALCGNTSATGLWDPLQAVALQYAGDGFWKGGLSFPKDKAPTDWDRLFEYKYVIRKDKTNQLLEWEKGPNRKLPHLPHTDKDPNLPAKGKKYCIISEAPYQSRGEGLRHAGTAIPVFSLRSKKSWGIGDFKDLTLMATWAERTGQRVLQILPVNDTTMHHNWIDSYPYGGISVMALHPLYANIEAMCPAEKTNGLKRFEKERRMLNELPRLDYDRVSALKWDAIRYLYKETGAQVMGTASFKSFVKENRWWLTPYALFCVLRDDFGTADFSQWGKYAHYNPDFSSDFESEKLNLYVFIQYHLDKQLTEAKDALTKRGIILKGDIPIGITPQSVEAWALPHLFHMESQAGAPPDEFSVHGQNWGFPTYNWEVMEKDGYAWWKNRFAYMARYFHAYRIDHILGFFRIWTIPAEQSSGLLGYFDPAMPFTHQELKERGVVLDHQRMVSPYITHDILEQYFGKRAEEIIATFLTTGSTQGRYHLKEAFGTQKQILAYFASLEESKENKALCDGLLNLCANVLFIAQPGKENAYHPRISAQFSESFKALDEETQSAFNRLYDHFFYHRHNEFWYAQAMKKLPPLISATSMLCCAEDLGMIPDCVHPVMTELSMLSLEVQRMPKDKHLDFGNPAQYPYLCVCTTGTHDMSTLRGWWEEDRDITNRFYHTFMGMQESTPYYCEPSVCQQIIEDHLNSPAMLCILPWQDWMALSGSLRRENPQEERINIPAIVPHYWQYRMHMTLEELLEEETFNLQLKDMVKKARRL
ncbi:MAG: 4-alpha-glucanotransferase [Bacteroidales bacterium]|nr:4-alpha-glucanotransferase [Bacteroidales bacterium]